MKTDQFLTDIYDNIVKQLQAKQDFTPGEYFGSIWSEQAYHGPLLDWNAGGAHHHRGASSAGYILYQEGKNTKNKELIHNAELAFDWLVSRQHPRGGWFEIQNNDKFSNWEYTNLEELSTIATGFAIHGLASAILEGLSPKKSYMNALDKAGHWFLSIENPSGSGIFPHHERSPYDTLNANMHAAEALMLIFRALREVYGRTVNIFLQGSKRACEHTLTLQQANGCMPYRINGISSINYTSLVLWCYQNILDNLPQEFNNLTRWIDSTRCFKAIEHGCEFICSTMNQDGSFDWDTYEFTASKFNIWTYFITLNVLKRAKLESNKLYIDRLTSFIKTQISPEGLPYLIEDNKGVINCAYQQADIAMFLKYQGVEI